MVRSLDVTLRLLGMSSPIIDRTMTASLRTSDGYLFELRFPEMDCRLRSWGKPLRKGGIQGLGLVAKLRVPPLTDHGSSNWVDKSILYGVGGTTEGMPRRLVPATAL